MPNQPKQQKQTKLAIVSDIHLDVVNQGVAEERIATINRVKADYLVMAGDICEMQYAARFLSLIKPNVKKVIVVKGNHEFYHSALSDDIEYPENFVCLRAGQPYVVDDLAFIGDTLWSNVPVSIMDQIERYMADYRLIVGIDDCEITCHDTNDLHEAQKIALLRDVLNQKDKKIVAVTHHAPSFLCVSPRFAGHFANYAFCSDFLEYVNEYAEVKPTLYVHGHTHSDIDIECYETRVVCNPWGYPNECRNELDFSDNIIKYVEI